MRRKFMLMGAILAAAVATTALLSASAGASTKLTKVTLQLKWVTQAQFAGYYAAAAQGYYKQAGLDVNLKVGGPNITPETVVIGGGADIGLDWLPNLFATDEKGGGLVSVAQVFARSGMTEITWKSSGINSIAKMRGKKVGVWCCGNQPELYAALTKNGIDPTNPKDVTIFNQPFDMNAFLSKQIDAAAAMTYNELAQVLETKNPATGKLYSLSDLNVFKMANVGTGMLEDNLFTTSKWLSNPTNQDTLVKFLKASFQGWIYCRDHAGGVREHRAEERPDARRRPPGVADERDQQAGLAEPERHRRRPGLRGRRDREHREDLRRDQEGAGGGDGQLHLRAEGARPAEGGGREHDRHGLQGRRREGHRGREVASWIGGPRPRGPPV